MKLKIKEFKRKIIQLKILKWIQYREIKSKQIQYREIDRRVRKQIKYRLIERKQIERKLIERKWIKQIQRKEQAKKKHSTNAPRLLAFSMIELIFVILILGIIATIAIPKISLTKNDAEFVAIVSDINTMGPALQQDIIMNDLARKDINISTLFDAAKLSHTRWMEQGGAIILGHNTTPSSNTCIRVELTQTELRVNIANSSTALCKRLHKEYPNPLVTRLF